MEEAETNGHKQIYGLMAQVLAEVGSVGKGRRNEQQGYSFRGIDDVYEAVHPLFSKHGIFTVPRVLSEDTTERTTQSGTILRFVKLTMAYDFFAPDGSSVTAEVIGEAMDAGDKASNKAMSAAQKYALIQTLCIPTGNTPDADYQTHEELTPETRQVSQNNTAPEVCPKCDGQMWNNRESKRNPKAPDYKCKNTSCDGAIWLPAEESKPAVNQGELVAFRKAAVDQCQLLNKAGDVPPWTAKRLDAFAVTEYGAKADDLELEPLRELVKKLSARYDRMVKPVPAGEPDAAQIDMIAKIEGDYKAEDIKRELKENFKGRPLESLSVPELNDLYDSLIPF